MISFSSPKPRARLLSGKPVFTVRRRRRRQFLHNDLRWGVDDWANDRRTGPKIADVRINEVGHVKLRYLTRFLGYSGFKSWREWRKEIKRLNPKWDYTIVDEVWVYRVTLRQSFFKTSKHGSGGANR